MLTSLSLSVQCRSLAALASAVLLSFAVSCVKEPRTETVSSFKEPVPASGHGAIVVSGQSQDPFSLENMQRALSSLGGTSVLSPTHIYLRFLPSSAEDISAVSSLGVPLFDHPLDCAMDTDGDYYVDPSFSSSPYTWIYAVLPVRSSIPGGLSYEILHECHISPGAKYSGNRTLSWEDIVAESFRDAGYLSENSSPSWHIPSGKITVKGADQQGTDVPVPGLRVVMSEFTLVSSAFTEDDGTFASMVSFPGTVRHRADFSDGENFVGVGESRLPFCTWSLGWTAEEKCAFDLSSDFVSGCYKRVAAFLAIRDYISLVESEDITKVSLPDAFSVRFLPGLDSEGMPLMSGRGAKIPEELLEEYLPAGTGPLLSFSPDAVSGEGSGDDFAQVYASVSKLTAACSLFSVLGSTSWSRSVSGSLSAELYGGDPSSYGQSDEVIRMWSSLLAGIMYRQRFGRDMPRNAADKDYLLILPEFYEKGTSLKEILSAISWRTTTAEELISAISSKM